MRYTSLASARKMMADLNGRRGYAPTAVYWSDDHGGYYTLVSAWSHGDRPGLTLVLSAA